MTGKNPLSTCDDHAHAEPAPAQRGAGDLTHGEQDDAGARLLADRAVRPNELGLAVGETEQLPPKDIGSSCLR